MVLARTRFRLKQAGDVRFRLGSDDAIRCWINGQHLCDAAYRRGYYLGNDEFLLTLPAGEHTLLLKIAQFEGDWCFGVDTVHEDTNPDIEWLTVDSA